MRGPVGAPKSVSCEPTLLPQLVHFKPGRRGVLRFGDHYLKIYAEDDKFERAVAGMEAAAVSYPGFEADLAALR